MKNISTYLLLVFLCCSGCHYLPFLKYYGTDKKTGFPSFSDRDRANGSQSSLQSNYDLISYDWHVKVTPEKKHIHGTIGIALDVLESSDTIIFNLQNHLKVKSITADFPIENWIHKKNLLFITPKSALGSGRRTNVDISYSGKPANVAGEGPIQWTKDALGQPWISSQTQGIGTHFMMPCKQLLYDEPEWCKINIEVPSDLMAVANGKLDSISKSPQWHTYHWSVDNPINIYNISFNIGDYAHFEKAYLDIKNKERKIHIYGLKPDIDTLSKFYNQAPVHMKQLEELFGPFPWWNDECKFVQTTLDGSAMEHQSAISMGSIMSNDYAPSDTSFHINTTLAHELAHEWWGNNVTGKDFCDAWLHEGFATYAEALVIEKIYGKENYDHYIQYCTRWIQNQRAILKPCGVKYNSWVNAKDYDIYYKGALMLHTVRRQLGNDQLFFKILKQAQSEFQKQNISTEEWVNYFNTQSNQDFTTLYDIYLNHLLPPTLRYSIDTNNAEIKYKWKEPMPAGLKFKIIYTVDGEKRSIIPTNQWQSESILSDSKVNFYMPDFGYVILEEE